jgi:hypothetical protein
VTDSRAGARIDALLPTWRPGAGRHFYPPCGVRRPGSVLLVVLLSGLAVA